MKSTALFLHLSHELQCSLHRLKRGGLRSLWHSTKRPRETTLALTLYRKTNTSKRVDNWLIPSFLGHPKFTENICIILFSGRYAAITIRIATTGTQTSDAEAQVEAIEEMEQQDQHHGSAQHCMDGAFLRGVTHGHTQSGLVGGFFRSQNKAPKA